MHVVLRLLFWLSLAGTVVALLAPTFFGGASWSEAQPAALLGLAFTTLLAFVAARVVSSSVAKDPALAARRRRSSAIAYAFVMLFVLAPSAVFSMLEATEDARNAAFTRIEADEELRRAGFGRSAGPAMLQGVEEDGWTGVLTSEIALGGLALAFLSLLVVATRRGSQPHNVPGMFPTTGAPYQPVVMAPYAQHFQQVPQHVWDERTVG